MDALSDVLSVLNARGMISGRLHAGGQWCIQSDTYESLRFGVLLEGTCSLQVEGAQDPVSLQAGDCYLLTDGRPYRIGNDLTMPSLSMREIFSRTVNGIVALGNSSESRLIGGRFKLDAADASFLIDSLPPIIHVSADEEINGSLQWAISALEREQFSTAAGASSMTGHLTHIMLIHIIRMHIASVRSCALTGWLAAMSDEKIGAALAAIHSTPFQRWTLKELADLAHMSRSAFALRFKTLVGTSPLHYVLRWRMRLAARSLLQGNSSISKVGEAFGYDSESAFSATFKRLMGCSPRAYRSLRSEQSLHKEPS